MSLCEVVVLVIWLIPHPAQERETSWCLVKLFLQLLQWTPIYGSGAALSYSKFHPLQRTREEQSCWTRRGWGQTSQKCCLCFRLLNSNRGYLIMAQPQIKPPSLSSISPRDAEKERERRLTKEKFFCEGSGERILLTQSPHVTLFFSFFLIAV